MARKEQRQQRLRNEWDGESANHLDGVLGVADSLELPLQLLGLPLDLKPLELGHKLVGGSLRLVLELIHEAQVRETTVEAGTITRGCLDDVSVYPLLLEQQGFSTPPRDG